nr:hypothetical protein [Tanacetum cinerariifolium]
PRGAADTAGGAALRHYGGAGEYGGGNNRPRAGAAGADAAARLPEYYRGGGQPGGSRGIWIVGTMRYARRHRTAPDTTTATPAEDATARRGQPGLVLLLMLVAFSVFGYGV